MPAALDAAPYLVAWIKHRVAEVGGRVYPHLAPQNAAPPYCTYARVGRVVHGDQRGPDGTVAATYQVDVWGQARAALERILQVVVGPAAAVGTPAAGLVGFAGLMELAPGVPRPAAAPPDRLYVQCVTLGDDAEEFYLPADGTGAGWVRQGVRLTVHHETELR